MKRIKHTAHLAFQDGPSTENVLTIDEKCIIKTQQEQTHTLSSNNV
jgi:hypothetical protein